MSISFAKITDLSCPQCGQIFQAEVWQIIDSGERPDLLRKVEQETIHTFSCRQCHHEQSPDKPLLLYRLGAWPKIIFSPSQKASKEQKLQQANDLLSLLRDSLAETWSNEWLKHVATVPRPVLSIFLREGPESAAARWQQIENFRRQTSGVQIPPAYEGEGRRIMDLTQKAQRNPAVLPELLSKLEFMLMRLTPDQSPVYWAALQNDLGNTYLALKNGDRAENLRQAIEHYQLALRYRTRINVPLDFAGTQVNLGLAYKNLAASQDRAENLRKAIECYQQALTVYTPDDTPLRFDAAYNNLGTVYKSLAFCQERVENLHKALDSFQQALIVYTPASAPLQFAA